MMMKKREDKINDQSTKTLGEKASRRLTWGEIATLLSPFTALF
jgi:hypothetical protein